MPSPSSSLSRSLPTVLMGPLGDPRVPMSCCPSCRVASVWCVLLCPGVPGFYGPAPAALPSLCSNINSCHPCCLKCYPFIHFVIHRRSIFQGLPLCLPDQVCALQASFSREEVGMQNRQMEEGAGLFHVASAEKRAGEVCRNCYFIRGGESRLIWRGAR